MASKLEIAQLSRDAGNKLYRFVLSEASQGELQLYHAPDGWNDYEIEYNRHKLYNSVLRKGSSLDLTFVKEGRDFLQAVYENTGIDADITITISKLEVSTNTYQDFPSPSKVSLAQYKIDETGVTVKLVDDDFKEKVFNREDTEVDILKLTSIDGQTDGITAFPITTITMPDTSIADESVFSRASSAFILDLIHIIPIQEDSSDFTETQTPTSGAAGVGLKIGSFFNSSLQTRLMALSIDIECFFIDGSGTATTYLVIIDSDEVEVKRQLVGTGTNHGNITFSQDIEYALQQGESMLLETTISSDALKFAYLTADMTINETYLGNPEKTLKARLDYEAFLRLGQILTNEDNPFYSDYFGRTDTPLTTYGSDGELGAVTRGEFFRNNDALTIPLTLKNFFAAKSSIFRLGLGVEVIGGVNKIRIEEMDYFFDENVSVDLSSKLRDEAIGKEFANDQVFKDVTTGYGKYAYEKSDGLLEFNTKSSWTTVIKAVFTSLKQLGKYRADGQGMRLIMNAVLEVDYDKTEDVKGDGDIFMVDLVRDGAIFKGRTDEGFDFIGGSIYAASSFNINWSPARNLLRWGQVIKAGLTKKLSSYLRWQTTDKNTTLQSRLSTEADTVEENADIQVTDLNDCRWTPEMYRVNVPLTTTELNAIDDNPNYLIKLADTKFGWILECKTTIKDGMTELLLLKYNADQVIPV